ncbi:unnamed protein product [Peniophora sp. CBMAI 1063]|nr:unnamed protein product [Peniophora sp. CBMAI 1063]
MAKRKREPTPEEEKEEDGEEFEINVIDKVRCVADEDAGSVWQYHVKWCGYPNSDDDTWEPHEGLEQTVPDLLERLWHEIDPKNEDKDYKVGDVLTPSPEWIEKEIRDSAERWDDTLRERAKKAKKKARKAESKKEARKKKAGNFDNEDDEEDVAFEVRKEEGLHKDNERLRSQKKKRPGAFDVTKHLADDLNEGAKSASDVGEASDEDSDTPLASQMPRASSGSRFVKKKENPYTLEPRAGPSKVSGKRVGAKRKVTGGREMTAESEDERPLTKLKKKRTLEPSPATSSARASSAGSAEVISAKGKGKARARIVSSSPVPEIQARQPGRSRAASPRPATPPPMSDADDASLFGSSPHKAPPELISAPMNNAARATASNVAQEKPTGPVPAGGSGPSRTKPTRPVQVMDLGYTDGSTLGTKAAVIRKPNPLAKAGFPKLAQKPPLAVRTGSKTGTPSGSPVISQGPRSASGTPRIAQQSPVVAQQHSSTLLQQSASGASTSPPTQYMDVDEPMVASPVTGNAEEFIMSALQQPTPSVPSLQPVRALAGTKIPKKWKWEGEAFVKRAAYRAEPFARVMISDAMQPREKGMRLNILFKTTEGESPLNSIKFEKLMGRSQILRSFRPACQAPSQFARLSASGAQDEKALDVLMRHMSIHDLGSYAFMQNSDEHPEALLILAPSSRYVAWGFANIGPGGKPIPTISEELVKGPFFVFVLPWNMSGQKISTYSMRPTGVELRRVLETRKEISPSDPVPKSTGRTLHRNPALERARRIIGLPDQLLKFLGDGRHRRFYAIWPYPSDGVSISQKVGAETVMLRDVLKAVNGQEHGLESNQVRVLFVHVGSIGTLSESPHILERRKQQLVQIFTYGTHHTVSPTQWGVREIYVYGGAVTFSPGLVKDAYGAARRIAEMADEHPMWTAFISPSVLALAAYEAYGENPIQSFDEHPERFPHRKLLELITSGRLAILRRPPTPVPNLKDHKERDEWFAWHRDIVYRGERDILVECLRWFNARYEREFERFHKDINVTNEENIRRFVLEELATTVNSVMVQPAMMESARRFVVVLGEGEHAVKTDKCGFEWETLSRFGFGDDFWREEDMAEMRQRLW